MPTNGTKFDPVGICLLLKNIHFWSTNKQLEVVVGIEKIFMLTLTNQLP